jgi:peptidyl-prolyl cis-trans isomerase C
MSNPLRSLILPLVLVGLAAPLVAQDAEPPTAETVVATVNGQEITLGHMIAARATVPAEYDSVPAEQLFTGILEQLIQQEALSQSVGELSPFIARTLENERRSIRAEEALRRELDGAVTEEEIRAAYDEAFADFESSEEYNASHILVPTREEAQAIKDELDAGANFAATARERSTGPSGPNGGELGWFGTGAMVPTFEAATIALGVGEISDPVETQFGWHVIRLNDARKSTPPPFESLRDQIEDNLRNAAARQIIEGATEGVTLTLPDSSTIDPAILTQLDLLEQ